VPIGLFGVAFEIAVAVTAFASAGDGKTPETFSSGFAAAMSIAAMLSFLGALAGIWLPGRPEAKPSMAKSAIEGTLGPVREK
jgi:hypothetical protein